MALRVRGHERDRAQVATVADGYRGHGLHGRHRAELAEVLGLRIGPAATAAFTVNLYLPRDGGTRRRKGTGAPYP